MQTKLENGTAALRKGLSILSCFSWNETLLSTTEIAKKLGLSLPTVSRMLKTLKEEGFLEQNPRTKLYNLSFNCYIMGVIAKKTGVLRSASVPYMRNMKEKFNETINLYIKEDNLRICYEQIESSQYLKRSARVGDRLPLCTGASGRCFLAFMPREDVRRIMRDIKPFTQNTILDINEVFRKNQQVRERGFSVSISEREDGVSSVAAPILDISGLSVACVAISGPSLRFTPEIVDEIIPELKASCYAISLKLGAEKDKLNFLK